MLIISNIYYVQNINFEQDDFIIRIDNAIIMLCEI